MQKSKTSTKILLIAREILANEGLGALSFDAIAKRLGRSKQAVLYWYPTKQALLSAMFVPWLQAESETAAVAVSKANTRTDAIGSFVRAIAGFHFNDLDRFRLMYLVPQTTSPRSGDRGSLSVGEDVYAVTDRLYGTLADHLDGERNAARKEAVAIHSGVLGIVLMVALTDALKDPLKHTEDELVEALIASLTSRI